MRSQFSKNTVGIPRMKVGKKQTAEILINEEALLFAKYLRNGIQELQMFRTKSELLIDFNHFVLYRERSGVC